ncbi:34149_t:CDS:1 [Racocetra persica]|uniref:34149_t:CDS:1 n=1 Tax=Racocetra persica TaxID=160502 RepID=A0ACA9MJA4_9GLOM|nr:34149_t:CDS:1 [Racocetra persica]
MEDENSQLFSSSQLLNESFANSIKPKNRSWVWKYFEINEVVETTHISFKYGICNVNDKLGKRCNIRLKVSGGSVSNLISHLLNSHGITQDRSEQDDMDK